MNFAELAFMYISEYKAHAFSNMMCGITDFVKIYIGFEKKSEYISLIFFNQAFLNSFCFQCGYCLLMQTLPLPSSWNPWLIGLNQDGSASNDLTDIFLINFGVKKEEPITLILVFTSW